MQVSDPFGSPAVGQIKCLPTCLNTSLNIEMYRGDYRRLQE